jgi:hypothetical protein
MLRRCVRSAVVAESFRDAAAQRALARADAAASFLWVDRSGALAGRRRRAAVWRAEPGRAAGAVAAPGVAAEPGTSARAGDRAGRRLGGVATTSGSSGRTRGACSCTGPNAVQYMACSTACRVPRRVALLNSEVVRADAAAPLYLGAR